MSADKVIRHRRSAVVDLLRAEPIRLKIVASLISFLATCAIPAASPEHHSVVTYYDRNRDGIADYELHQVPGTTYWTWAYVDSKFTGGYDVRLKLAYPFGSDAVNIPVPRHVKLIPGMPPAAADQRFDAPTPAP
jgi:hypothetical protein